MSLCMVRWLVRWLVVWQYVMLQEKSVCINVSM
jgi:hypothetical protein